MAKTNKGFLSASVIKLIAIASMIIDHGSIVLTNSTPVWPRVVGRIAFPLFAFLLAQGVRHTRSKGKYLLRMLFFAFLSEIPFDWVLYGELLRFDKQNVYFTLFLGLCSAMILQTLLERRLGFLGVFSTVLFSMAALFLKSDYGFMGVVVITLMYLFDTVKGSARNAGLACSCVMTCFTVSYPFSVSFNPLQIFSVAAIIPIALYSGKRGFKMNKYVFYLVYPIHLLVLLLIKSII